MCVHIYHNTIQKFVQCHSSRISTEISVTPLSDYHWYLQAPSPSTLGNNTTERCWLLNPVTGKVMPNRNWLVALQMAFPAEVKIRFVLRGAVITRLNSEVRMPRATVDMVPGSGWPQSPNLSCVSQLIVVCLSENNSTHLAIPTCVRAYWVVSCAIWLIVVCGFITTQQGLAFQQDVFCELWRLLWLICCQPNNWCLCDGSRLLAAWRFLPVLSSAFLTSIQKLVAL